MLYELAGEPGLPPGARAVDVGCGEGRHTLELARRFGLDVVGIDPLDRHLEIARETARLAGADRSPAGRVRFEAGIAERIPLADGSVDLVWCRDVLVMVEDLPAAFREFRRVLAPGGRAVIYQMFATERLEPSEAAWLLPVMGCVARNMEPGCFETAIADAGLAVTRREVLGPEWGEYAQERTGKGARMLLHAARLLRAPGRYIDAYGHDNYEIALGDALWHVYRLIGKLSDRVYVLGAR
jgi:SAM-dependent methyltransferase